MQSEKCCSQIATDGSISKRWNVVRCSITPAERQQLHSSRLHCSAWEKTEPSEKDVQGKLTNTSGQSSDLLKMHGVGCNVLDMEETRQLQHLCSACSAVGSKATHDHSRVKVWNPSMDGRQLSVNHSTDQLLCSIWNKTGYSLAWL